MVKELEMLAGDDSKDSFSVDFTRDSSIASVPSQVLSALALRDEVAFYLACLKWDFSPQDEIQRELYDIGYHIQNPVNDKKPNLSGRKGKATHNKRKIDYGAFLNLTDSYMRNHGIKPSDIFHKPKLKREILEAAGYSHAYGKGERIPLSDASDARIGSMFKKTYEQAIKSQQSKAESH